VPKINVTFQLDVNGLLSVSAREEQTGQEQSIKIEGASVLGREEITKMIKEAEENAALDKSKKSLVNITYELDNLLSKSETFAENYLTDNTTSQMYFLETIKEIQDLYNQDKLSSVTSLKLLENLKYAYSIIVLEYFKNELNKKSGNKSQKGVVIDITDD
jgi:molecular chaperone DnaK